MANDMPRRSSGPRLCAGLFKVVAVVAIVAGAVAAAVVGVALTNDGDTVGHSVDVAFLVFVGGIVTAASVAFYGYVLDLLADIRDNSDLSVAVAMIEDDDASIPG